jgi:type I restriction enzyme S subunit
MDSSNKDKGVWPSDKLPFTWAWAPMDLVFNNETSSNRKLKQKKYLPEGRIAVIDQGQELVGGYTNDDNIAFTGELPVIIFGDHTRCVKYIDFPFAQGADGVKVLSPTSLVDPKFSYYSLLTLSLPDKGYSRHFKFLKETQFPIPSLPEQKRIAKKIDALQSRSSKARKALEAIPPLLDKFRQSVLSSAFRGDLTADWRAQNPDIEPAEKLLERIRKERRKRWEEDELAKMKAKGQTPKDDKWKKKYKEPEPVDTTDLPGLPEGWCWTTIDTIAFVTKLAGFEYTKYVTYDPNGDLPVIKAENAGKYGFKETDFSFVQSESVTHLTRSFLKGGEVLMTFVGAGVGQVAMVPEGQQYFLGPNIAMIRNESSFVLPRYIELFLRSPLGFGLAMSFVKAVAQPSLSMKTIRKIPIAIPPIKEQKIIVSNLSQYNDIIEEVGSIITTLKEKHLTLDQSILSKAFRGELVPQDPNDEPASVLLERIKQEMASLEAEKKQKVKVGKKKTVIRKKEVFAMAKKKERRPLVEVLQPHSSGLSPEKLFQQAGFDEYLVDEFYIELKNEVVSGNIIEDRPDQERVLLRLNAA